MSAFLPNAAGLAAVFVTWIVTLVLTGFGALVIGRRRLPELQMLAGWACLCLLLTIWGGLTAASLRIPAAAFGLVVLGAQALPGGRLPRGHWVALGRLALISLPFWLVMASIRPSQIDTFLNLLPNASYLVDHGMLPTDARPPSHSFIAAAPYNTQFVSFLGSLLLPDYPAPGMSLFNLMLLLMAGQMMARRLCGGVTGGGAIGGEMERPLPWRLVALGLLLAIPFNLGFAPRVSLSPYGETGLSVTCLAAILLIEEALARRLAKGAGAAATVLPLGLVLAAMVNIKQSGIGLVAAVAAAGLAVGLWERRIALRPALRYTMAALLPAAVLYGFWRWFVLSHFVEGELKPLPLSQWQWSNIPAILVSILATMANKGFYFGVLLLVVAGLFWLRRRCNRETWTPATRLLALHLWLFVFYVGFLVTTYIGHFQGTMSVEAHSFFRYNVHLSLVLTLSAAVLIVALLPEAGRWRRYLPAAGSLAVLLALLLPPAAARLLRFDLEQPQPLVWDLAKEVAPLIGDGQKLAILLPGDNETVAPMLRDLLMFTEPKRHDLDLMERRTADAATLAEAAARGYETALVTCVPPGLADAPAHAAALLRYRDGAWYTQRSWVYPDSAYKQRWQQNLAWEPLCR